MAVTLRLTRLPHLNSIAIKQSGGHFFIAAPDSFIIDKDGMLTLIEELTKHGFISMEDLADIVIRVSVEKEKHEN